jgi:hypothetical protein
VKRCDSHFRISIQYSRIITLIHEDILRVKNVSAKRSKTGKRRFARADFSKNHTLTQRTDYSASVTQRLLYSESQNFSFSFRNDSKFVPTIQPPGREGQHRARASAPCSSRCRLAASSQESAPASLGCLLLLCHWWYDTANSKVSEKD